MARAVAAGSFNSNNQLRAGRLDRGRLTGIEGLFSKVPQLMWLSVSEDSIQALDCSLVPLTCSLCLLSPDQAGEGGPFGE